jgi:hypothetical protein
MFFAVRFIKWKNQQKMNGESDTGTGAGRTHHSSAGDAIGGGGHAYGVELLMIVGGFLVAGLMDL